MHALALGFTWDDAASSAPRVPRLLPVLVFVVTLGRRLLNWIVSPLRGIGILEEAHQYSAGPPDVLTLWPITPPSTTTPNTSSSSAIDHHGIIRENLPVVVEYCSSAADGEGDITCAVCLNDFLATDRIRRLGKCGHVFHMECLDKWIEYRSYSCPLCRSPIF